MTAIADIYGEKKQKDQESLKQIFDSYDKAKADQMQFQDFANAIKNIERSVEDQFIETMFKEGCGNQQIINSLNFKAFQFLVTKYAIGDYGINVLEASKILKQFEREEESKLVKQEVKGQKQAPKQTGAQTPQKQPAAAQKQRSGATTPKKNPATPQKVTAAAVQKAVAGKKPPAKKK